MKTVMCYGDSLTWGYNPKTRGRYPFNSRWPGVLQKSLEGKIRVIVRVGRGRSLRATIEELTPLLRGWSLYFKLSEVKTVYEELDGWVRRKLRCIL